MPPNPRPIPRFIADSTQEGIPHGRFAERLAAEFRQACEAIEDLPQGVEAPAAEAIAWFPERAWGGRVWVPFTARVEGSDGGEGAGSEAGEEPGALELFGHVSYAQPED